MWTSHFFVLPASTASLSVLSSSGRLGLYCIICLKSTVKGTRGMPYLRCTREILYYDLCLQRCQFPRPSFDFLFLNTNIYSF